LQDLKNQVVKKKEVDATFWDDSGLEICAPKKIEAGLEPAQKK